jgi:hypothetical protein
MDEMTSQTVRLPVQNSLLYIKDSRTNDWPYIDGIQGVWTTLHCVAVSCLPDCDGETTLTVGTMDEVSQSEAPRFEGRLKTPSRRVVVDTVADEKVIEMPVLHTDTRIRIWTDGHLGTEFVIVGLE